jgi:hypothetical protein
MNQRMARVESMLMLKRWPRCRQCRHHQCHRPGTAMVWGYVGLGEVMTTVQIGGAALVLAGVLLVTWKPARG